MSWNANVPLHWNSLPRHIAGKLPQPTVDYPLQTTRAAIDLVMTGTFAKRPNLEIILSHAGGALPFLAKRALGLLGLNQVAEGTVSREQACVQTCSQY